MVIQMSKSRAKELQAELELSLFAERELRALADARFNIIQSQLVEISDLKKRLDSNAKTAADNLEAVSSKYDEFVRVISDLVGSNNSTNPALGAAAGAALRSAECIQLKEENKKYREEMDKITQGIPSDWAYAILLKERNELKTRVSELNLDLAGHRAAMGQVKELIGEFV